MMKLSNNQKTLHQMSIDEKFFMRVLSKESCVSSTPSFRIYYGVSAAGAVPFHWESQPGTPKLPHTTSSLPPLTPPPSYYSKHNNTNNNNSSNSHKTKLYSLLQRLSFPKKPQSLSPSSSAASSSSSRSHRRGQFSSSFSSNSKSCDDALFFDSGLSPSSTLSLRRRPHAGGSKSGCYSMFVMKTMLLSIVGHGSAA